MSHHLPHKRLGATAILALAVAHIGCVIHEGPPVYVQAPPPPPPATVVVEEQGAGDVVVEDFNEPLANYGVWVYDPIYGRVWQPASDMAGPDFVPYGSDGTWVTNDDGDWVFVSTYDRQWGWATYHYGRWVWTDVYGWVWTPGRAWAPAWVEWRYGGGYVGWVPMGPHGYVVHEEHWVFVEETHIGATAVISHRLPPERAHGAYIAAAPIVEVHGAAGWRAGPPAPGMRSAGIDIPSAKISAPASGYVKAQARVASESAAERRSTGRVVTTPQVRPGQVAPDPAMYRQNQPQSQPGMAPNNNNGAGQVGRSNPGSMPGSSPVQNPGMRPSPMPSPSPQPQPMPAARPSPQPQPVATPRPPPVARPAPPPAPARPAPRPAAPPSRPSPPKRR